MHNAPAHLCQEYRCQAKFLTSVKFLPYCWACVASSTWSVLWLRNTNRERLQKQVQKTTWKFADNLIKQWRQRRNIGVSKVMNWTQEEWRRILDLQTLDVQGRCIAYLLELSYIYTPFAIASHH